MTLNRALMFVGLLACANSGAAEDSADRSLAASMDRAWEVSWQRFYLPKTKLFYDYLSSYEPGRELVHLPTVAEVARQYPNEYG